MCGVFGYVSFDGKGPSIKRLQSIASVTMRRGPHAFGFSWIDSKGALRMFKKTGPIVDHLGLLAMAHDAQMLIGHCRYATHGDPSNNLNNHPHPADGGWIVHNGVIADHREIVQANGLFPNTSCDSEVLGLLIERAQGTRRNRCIEAIQIAGQSPLVMMGLWSRPGRMIALRSGNPLALGICNGRAYLGSLEENLPGKVLRVPDGGGVDCTKDGMTTIKFTRECERAIDADCKVPSGAKGAKGNAKPAAQKSPAEVKERTEAYWALKAKAEAEAETRD